VVGGLPRRERAIADEAFAFAADDSKDFTHGLDLRLVH
jgi:hypothetical protein